jgi:hypothetical protein
MSDFQEERKIGRQRRGRGFISRFLCAGRWMEDDCGFKYQDKVFVTKKWGEVTFRRVK